MSDFGLRKRGKIWHYRFILNGNLVHGSTKTRIKDLAVEFADQVYQKAYRQEHDIPQAEKVEIDMFIEYHLNLKGGNSSQNWRPVKSHYLRSFMDYVRKETVLKHVNELGLTTNFHYLEQYQYKLLECMAPKSAKNHITAIGAMLNHALKLGYIRSNPVRKLDPIRGIQKNKKRYLSKDEIRTLLDRIQGTYLHDFVLVGIYTGMRKSELINLEYDDIDMERKLIYVKNKGDFLVKSRKERAVPLHQDLADIFPPSRPAAGRGYCFLRNGRKIHKDAVTRDFRRVADGIGLHDVTIHTLRHTFISHCLMDKISIWEVAQWVGHSSVYITELYSHLCPDRREIDKLQILA